MRKGIALILSSALLASVSISSVHAAGTIAIVNSQEVIGSVETVPNIWKGAIPTKVAYASESFSETLEFPIQGILPFDKLSDRATGVKVEFEVWSQAGKRIASDTIYNFDWNPVGPNTLVSMYLYNSDAIGTHTMIIRTIYEVSTTGLLTRYVRGEVRLPFEVNKVSKPGSLSDLKYEWQFDQILYTFSSSESDSSKEGYELGIAYLLNPNNDKTKYASYSSLEVIKKSSLARFELKYSEILDLLQKKNLNVENSAILLRMRAVNTLRVGDWNEGIYLETISVKNTQLANLEKERKLAVEQAAKLAAEEKARAEAELKAKLPKKVQGEEAKAYADGITFLFDASGEGNSPDYYEVGLSRLIYPNTEARRVSSFTTAVSFKKISGTDFTLTRSELEAFLNSEKQDLWNTAVLIQVRGVNAFGSGEWSDGIYSDTSRFFSAPIKKVSIKCKKGKLIREVTRVAPRCPKGFKRLS